MAKGSVLTFAFIETIGLAASTYTLSNTPINVIHPQLQEPMFTIQVEEFDETIYLDRQYCFDNQFTLPSYYGAGNKILLWIRRVTRYPNRDQSKEGISLYMASDCFLFDQPLEFQRFRIFLRSRRILDTQARDYLVRFSPTFAEQIQSEEGLEKVLDCLGNITEWPEQEAAFHRHSASDATHEGLAKAFSKDLLPVREYEELPAALLKRNNEQRENIFKILYYVRDEKGSESLQVFLRDLGTATGKGSVIRKTARIKTATDLTWALEALRNHLGINRSVQIPPIASQPVR